MTPENTIAAEILLLQAEEEISRLKSDIQLKIALKADKYYMQLQAIRESAFGDISGITAEDLSFMSERE
jgi:hypothetical protein